MAFLKFSIILLIALFLLACEPEKPFVLPIEEDKLVDVLCDVHIAEAALKNLKGKTKDSITNVYYNQIYTIHKLDSTLFKETMETLRKRPATLQKLYTKVKEKLTILEKEIDPKKNKKSKKKNPIDMIGGKEPVDSIGIKFIQEMIKK